MEASARRERAISIIILDTHKGLYSRLFLNELEDPWKMDAKSASDLRFGNEEVFQKLL